MSEEVTAGGREFVFALLWAAALYFVCYAVMALFNSYAFIGGIISVIIFAVYGFFVLTRYTARFTYTLKDGRLRINRMIGKRNKEIEISCGDITGLYYGYKPMAFPKTTVNMRKSIINKRHSLYIEYRGSDGTVRGAVIERSEKHRKKIERAKGKGKGK